MAVSYPKIGNKVVGKVIAMEGNCSIGMQIGEEFELDIHQCGEFCGYFYHNVFNMINILQFGGTFPAADNPDVLVWECPNTNNRVKVELRRDTK